MSIWWIAILICSLIVFFSLLATFTNLFCLFASFLPSNSFHFVDDHSQVLLLSHLDTSQTLFCAPLSNSFALTNKSTKSLLWNCTHIQSLIVRRLLATHSIITLSCPQPSLRQLRSTSLPNPHHLPELLIVRDHNQLEVLQLASLLNDSHHRLH